MSDRDRGEVNTKRRSKKSVTAADEEFRFWELRNGDAFPAPCRVGHRRHVSRVGDGNAKVVLVWFLRGASRRREPGGLGRRVAKGLILGGPHPQSTEVEKRTPEYRLGKGGDFS